jgi:hypothetical protein
MYDNCEGLRNKKKYKKGIIKSEEWLFEGQT